MIHGVFGKLGSGKGLLIIKRIADELLDGFRDVVTNVPVRVLPWVNGQGQPQIGLRAYIAEEMKGVLSEAELDGILGRLLVIEDIDKGADLFLWRRDGNTGEWFKLPATHPDEKGRPSRFDAEQIKLRNCAPVLVATDEAWQFYPNNGGWSRSPILPFYARQQRKLRDEWYIITQHPTDVDSVVWNIAQDFQVCRNHGMERMGIFRQPEIFRVLTYVTNPAKGNAIVSHESIHRLDRKRLAQCYDTTAGVGISGGFKGDANQQRKGIHVGWAVAGVVLVVGALVMVPHLFGRMASGWIGHVTTPPKSATQWAGLKPLPKVPVTFANAPAAPEFRGPMPTPATNALAQSDEVYCTGFCIFSNGPVIFLSDGTVLEGQADGIESVSPTAVYVHGKKYVVRRYRPAPYVAPMSNDGTTGGTGQPQTTIAYQESKPVNQAIILPAIHAQGGTPPPRLNGIGAMNHQFSQNRQSE
jgi:hypothetical protein